MSRQLPIMAPAPARPVPGRSCGTCSMCCTNMGVPDLATAAHPEGKARNVACAHLRRGSIAGACSIYAARPASCRAFACLWLQGLIPNDLRPDKIRAVGSTNARGDILVFHVAPAHRGAHTKGPLAAFIERAAARGVSIIVVTGDERAAYGPVAREFATRTQSPER